MNKASRLVRFSIKKLVIAISCVLIFFVVGELFARFGLGLGSPPLYMTHPRIEYMFQPNQNVNRFGNRVLINAYGMRSVDFPPEKKEGEFRVIIFGDSVLNGGGLTDHSKLATTILSDRLATVKGRPVAVGNVSAGSWGPGNWLAYAQEYGFFDADVLILLISSHDSEDNPTFAPLESSTHPYEQPVSALSELFSRYITSYIFSAINFVKSAFAVSDAVVSVRDFSGTDRGLSDLNSFLDLAQDQVERVVVVQFPERNELPPNLPQQGYDLIKKVAEKNGVEIFSAFPAIQAAFINGQNPYRDNIHVNDMGQWVLAEVFFNILIARDKEVH